MVLPRLCILASYLAEQEINCRRMQRTANMDTPHAQEWKAIAETLCVLRVEHSKRCARCGSPAAVVGRNGAPKAQ
jgi:hypothetical protein